MLKRMISLLMCVAMVISMLPVQVFATDDVGEELIEQTLETESVEETAEPMEATEGPTEETAEVTEAETEPTVETVEPTQETTAPTEETVAEEPEVIPVESVIISQAEGITELAVGETLQLTATVLPENATDKTVVWSSSDETVAMVDETGVVAALSVGNVFITANVEDEEDTYVLTVVEEPFFEMVLKSYARSAITNPNGISGNTFSSTYASKLDNIFQGKVALFSNTSATYALGQSMKTGTDYSVAGKITGWECYIYANAVYYYLFGDIPYHGNGISGYWNNSNTVLTNQKTASYDLFNKSGVGFGAYIRTTNKSDGSYNGSSGHSMIVLSYDSSGITYLDSNSNAKGLVRVAVETWDEFNASQTSGKNRRISHIVQCKLTGPSYADLGTDFTAPILYRALWATGQHAYVLENSYTESDKPPVRIQTEKGKANQLWYFSRQSDGSYKISSCQDGKYLDVRDAGTGTGVVIQTCVDSGSDAQKWYLIEKDGGYIFKSKLSGYVLDLVDNNATAGNTLQTWEENGTSAQVWAIYRGDECKLKGPTLSVSAGTSTSNTKFTWSEVYGEREYNVKIWKNKVWEGDPYHIEWCTSSGYSLKLPAGTYQAYVDAANFYKIEMSNLVTFTIAEHQHSYKTAVTNATCTAQGYTTYTCSSCGYSYKGNYTNALGHKYSYKVGTTPTTSASGKLTGTCSRCSGTTTVTLPKLNTTDYNYKVVTAAGCTTNGTGRYTWKTTTYGTFYFDVSISKTGHSYSYKATKSPSTGATGTLTGTCSKCNGTTTVTLPKLNTTDYSYKVVTAAGCDSNGTGRYTWKTTTYGTFYFDVSISKTGHSYSYKATKSPSTGATGTLTGTCSKCNGTTTVTLPKLNTSDYNYTVVTAAGCTSNGTGRYTWKTTTYGSYSFDVILDSLDHNYQSVVTAPTCTSGGFTTFTCSRCEDSYIGAETPAAGHSWNDGNITVSATCTADGEKVFTCGVCSETRNEVIPAVGHSYNAVVTDPTCTEQGFTTYTCAICNDSYVDSIVAELGHNYEYGSCARCGEADPNAIVAEGSCGDDATWTLDINGVLTVSGTGAMNDFVHTPNIPWYDYRYDIYSVIIADGITEIGSHSFWSCPNLSSVSIASSVAILGSYCFAYADSLKQIAIPEGVTTIEGSAFLSCENLETVSLPMTITYISGSVFADCVQLTAITLPDGVTDIWNYTFSGCQKLTSVHLGENVKSIGVSSFANCTSLTEINLPNSITAIGKQAFLNCKALSDTNLPGNITTIGESAFEGCSNLQNITFGDDLVEIGKRAFWGCSTIVSVLIPSSVTFVGSNAFGNCGSLNAINVEPNNGNYFSDSMGVLYDKAQTVLLCIPNGFTGEYDLPVSVTEIASGAASGCINLKGIALNDGLQIIGEYAFANCVQLTTVTIPKTVTGVNRAVFQGCSSMDNLVFLGDAPTFNWKAFDQLVADAYYPANNDTWTSEIMQDYGGTITWVPYGNVENKVTIPMADLNGQTSVWIDGREFAVQTDGGISYVDLPDGNAKTMTIYTYGTDDGKEYPVSMKVWTLENLDGFYTATRQEEFDDILQYSGSSIRVTGKKGIRMITAIDQEKKKDLTSDGLAGYTLKEYGTAIAWASQISDSKPLVLGKSWVKSNYAYKQGVADPVFAYKDGKIQYTNVLVNFSDAQCSKDIAMRPYMILTDGENDITLYGGIVERSIGYIALQNKDTFTKGTEEYNYIWRIIRSVYGDAYDE